MDPYRPLSPLPESSYNNFANFDTDEKKESTHSELEGNFLPDFDIDINDLVNFTFDSEQDFDSQLQEFGNPNSLFSQTTLPFSVSSNSSQIFDPNPIVLNDQKQSFSEESLPPRAKKRKIEISQLPQDSTSPQDAYLRGLASMIIDEPGNRFANTDSQPMVLDISHESDYPQLQSLDLSPNSIPPVDVMNLFDVQTPLEFYQEPTMPEIPHPFLMQQMPFTFPVPATTSLANQMETSYKRKSKGSNNIAIYNLTQTNIKDVLTNVLPEIEKLDQEYENICKAFAAGDSPSKPEGMKHDLMPYQWRGYKWMEIFYQFGIGGCLADEMGLGKTIQSIALIQELFNQKKGNVHILICCPANLTQNWMNEIKSNCPELERHTSDLTNATTKNESSPICIMSNQKLRRLRPKKKGKILFPFNQEWDLIFIDEFHSFLGKTNISGVAVNLLRQKTKGLFALTGTPMPNNLLELYKLNAMLNPSIYPKFTNFNNNFIIPAKQTLENFIRSVNSNHGKVSEDPTLNSLELYVIQFIEILTKPFFLRRVKKSEEFKSQTAIMQSRGSHIRTLPPLKPEQKTSYSFTDIQETLVYSISGTRINVPHEKFANDNGGLSLFNTSKTDAPIELIDFLCLQSLANHPSLLSKSEKLMSHVKQINPDFEKMINDVKVDFNEEGKLKAIISLVGKILNDAPNDKILIFTNFIEMGHLIREGLKSSLKLIETMKKVEFLYGEIKKGAREFVIKRFKDPNGPPVLIAARRLGSVGWNCIEANHVILADPWWNPNDDDQCIGRIYRLGQKKTVHVYRMHRDGFVADDHIRRMCAEKKAWCELILDGNTSNVKEKIRNLIEGNYHSSDTIEESSTTTTQSESYIIPSALENSTTSTLLESSSVVNSI